MRTAATGVENRWSLRPRQRSFVHHVLRSNNLQDGLPKIRREDRPCGDHLGQFFVLECHRLTIGVIVPLPRHSHVLQHVP